MIRTKRPKKVITELQTYKYPTRRICTATNCRKQTDEASSGRGWVFPQVKKLGKTACGGYLCKNTLWGPESFYCCTSPPLLWVFHLKSSSWNQKAALPSGITSRFWQEEGKRVFSTLRREKSTLQQTGALSHWPHHVTWSPLCQRWLGKLNIQIFSLCSRRRQGKWTWALRLPTRLAFHRETGLMFDSSEHRHESSAMLVYSSLSILIKTRIHVSCSLLGSEINRNNDPEHSHIGQDFIRWTSFKWSVFISA